MLDGGYEVIESPSSDEALALAASARGRIGLLLTDVVMPGLSGPDLAECLKAEGLVDHVLFMSGYTDDAISHHKLSEPGVHFLQKPFLPRELLRIVRAILDERQPAA